MWPFGRRERNSTTHERAVGRRKVDLKEVCARLDSDDPGERFKAINFLWLVGIAADRPVKSQIIGELARSATADPDVGLRQLAVHALTRIDRTDLQTMLVLQQLANDPDPEQAAIVRNAIADQATGTPAPGPCHEAARELEQELLGER